MKIIIIQGKAFEYKEDTLMPIKDGVYSVKKESDIRTLAQNRSYHLWATKIADRLNAHGLSIPRVIKLDTSWDMMKVVELVFKPTIKALYNKKSSTQLKKDEYDAFIDVITKAFGAKGVSIPKFPSRDELYFDKMLEKMSD